MGGGGGGARGEGGRGRGVSLWLVLRETSFSCCVCVLVARVTAGGVGQRELLQTEGTVILHITFALKQDQVGRKRERRRREGGERRELM